MSEAALGILLMFICLLMALCFLLIFVWAIRDGRFRDIQAFKYWILRENEDKELRPDAETLSRDRR